MSRKHKDKGDEDLKKKKNREHKNYAEQICIEAAEILIKEGKLSEYKRNRELDGAGIDIVLFKHIKTGRHLVRLGLHLQIKQSRSKAKRHKNRYPCIPAYVVLSEKTEPKHAAKGLWKLFCRRFKKSRYYQHLQQRNHIN